MRLLICRQLQSLVRLLLSHPDKTSFAHIVWHRKRFHVKHVDI